MEQPLISCIVPVFNGERYLREALDSILAQTYRPLEIIVADDGSGDGTAGVVATFGDQVRYIRQPNQGPSSARNLGMEWRLVALVVENSGTSQKLLILACKTSTAFPTPGGRLRPRYNLRLP